jgi:cyd operon protein YbgT
MWYFAWILGTAFACSLAILYGLWLEMRASTEI